MKLEKYVDNSRKKRKILLISISVIVLISASFLLYKTFAFFTESAEFPIMNGKVDYFGNSDIYFVFYQGDKELDEMPQKDNKENLVFDHGTCDNGASIIWDGEAWGPMVKNLSKSKTKCSLYFMEKKSILLGGNEVNIVESGDGLYAVSHENLEELGQEWNKTEYRYAGSNPNNYLRFNNEIWRIIGLVNVKTTSGVEQRIKIIRLNKTTGQEDFGTYSWHELSNDWTQSSLKNMLNGIYYESESGYCSKYFYTSDPITCDFSKNGINDNARNMIDSDVIWNIGGLDDTYYLTSVFYEKERGTDMGLDNEYPSEWAKENDKDYHNGIGLMYPSDYGYAVGGDLRNTCLAKTLDEYDYCTASNWLYYLYNEEESNTWTMTPYIIDTDHVHSISWIDEGALEIEELFTLVPFENYVDPTLYLKSSIKIESDSSNNYGSIDNPFRLTT